MFVTTARHTLPDRLPPALPARSCLPLHLTCPAALPCLLAAAGDLQVVAFSFLYLQPLHRGWSSWAYSKLMLVLVFSQALKVNTAHGWPAGWTLSAIQQWLMRVVPTSDAQYFLLAFAAAGNSKPVTAVLPPFLVLAAYQLAHFLASSFGSHPLWQRHGVHLYRQMQAKQQVALAFNAQSEIMLGFLLLLGLPFPGRAPMLAFMVAQFLRMRYWSSDGALYHRQVRAQGRARLAVLCAVLSACWRFTPPGRPNTLCAHFWFLVPVLPLSRRLGWPLVI